MNYILFNHLANNGTGASMVAAFKQEHPGEYEEKDVTELDYQAFLDSLTEADEIYLIGGDGTLNYFVNELGDRHLSCKAYIYSAGTGNDFLRDVAPGSNFVQINEYIENLPTVYVNGMARKFINNMGFGIDGYCCEVADKQKAKSDKPVNYTKIAILGLLFHYKRTKVTIKVDGVEYTHKHVWLTPTMKGSFYGGGMNIAPEQDRKSGLVTVVVFKGLSKISSLMAFPDIFKGKLGDHKKKTVYYTGKEIEVTFDRPTAAQIDGETVLNVTSYKVVA